MKVVASIVSDVDGFFGVCMKLLSIGPRTDHCLLAWPVELMWLWSIETLHTVCLVGTSAYCASIHNRIQKLSFSTKVALRRPINYDDHVS